MRDAAIPSNRQPRRGGTGRSAPERPRGDLSSAEVAAQRLGGDLGRSTGRTGGPARRTATARRWGIPPVLKRVRPVKALTTVVFSAALVGIVANAVLFQKGLHTGTPFDILHGLPARPPAAPEKVAASDPGSTGAVAAAPEAISGPRTDAVHPACGRCRSGGLAPAGIGQACRLEAQQGRCDRPTARRGSGPG